MLAVSASFLVALPTQAAATCTFVDLTATVTVAMADGDDTVVSRLGDAIAVDGVACGTANVTNTDMIVVTSTGSPAALRIDLGGGAFAPGKTIETDAVDSEIEWQVTLPTSANLRILGTPASDNLVIGASGINLNGAEATGDADVVVTGSPSLFLVGLDGNDVLSVGGGSGTGAPGPTATLLGGPAGDLFLPGAIGSTFDGGDGPDAIDYSSLAGPIDANLQAGTVHVGASTDVLTAIENLTATPGDDVLTGDGGPNLLHGGPGNDRIAGGAGDDTLDGGVGTDLLDLSAALAATVDLVTGVAGGDGTDAIAAFEDILGSPGDDTLVGDDGANAIDGDAGDDEVAGGLGSDDLTGAAGTDTVSFVGAPDGVTVDLAEGTATGAGEDVLAGFENVDGSGRADVIHGDDSINVLDGRTGADEVYGQDGADRILGDRARDLLFGQSGNDVLLGGPNHDQLDGGEGTDDVCRGGQGPDAFVFCENHPTSTTGLFVFERS